MADQLTNVLYYGDNLDVLRLHVKDETVDLVYLDPPFNSNATYNVLFAEQNGSQAAAQIKAFEDTWRWDQAAAEAYQEVVEGGGKVSQAMQAFRQFLGDSDMLAYLAMMAPRLMELRRALKSTGSIYLHCDPTASHYLKMLMDAIFSPENFRNEIIWAYRGGGSGHKDFGHRHDVILRYSKTKDYCFYPDAVRVPYQAEGISRTDDAMWGKHRGTEKVYKPHPLGKVPEDWWPINILNANDPERLGYPTQKPEALLERIIKASSNEDDVVLDPFCGCGTTIAVAQRLKRRWIGIDITHLAVGLIKHRLRDAFGDAVAQTYQTIGEPTSLPDAATLAAEEPFQFQAWALGLVGARVASSAKKGADKGIDGRLYFHDEAEGGKTKQVILSVKAGNTNVAHLRDLRGVLERERAEIGVLLTMEEPTKPMRTEAAGAGFYNSPWGSRHPRLQILTVRELLAGRMVDIPASRDLRTFKKAPRVKRRGMDTPPLLPTE
jgi:site-specific DNA-methyltransferase (adenine-specific)